MGRTGNFDVEYHSPPAGAARGRLERFLAGHGLEYEGGVDFTVNLIENGEIVATGSLAGDTLRSVAVSWAHRSRGLAATVVSELAARAAALGRRNLFLFTHPRNRRVFASLGFYAIASADGALLMEDRRDGLDGYVRSLARPSAGAGGTVGCVFADCNPFTNGHLHLVETAARECLWVHLFVPPGASDGLPAELRREMAAEGTRHLSNVLVQPSAPYLAPPHSFPDWPAGGGGGESDAVNCALGFSLFAERIAKPLGIGRRYVGLERGFRAGAAHNREMLRLLPGLGVDVVEVPRLAHGGTPVTGGRARRLCAGGRLAELAEIVPASTLALLASGDAGGTFFAVI